MRLLIIDPNESLAPGTLRGLTQEGFIADRVKLIKRGIWMARVNPYDAVVLLIPSFQVLLDTVKHLSGEFKNTYVVALLGAIALEKRIMLLEKGLDEALVYPCSFRELVIKMRNLLRREKSHISGATCFQVDNLFINLASFAVRRGPVEIYLRRKEFDLLLYLVRHQGRVITKAHILECVWDANADLFTNTLEVHILNLRRKIDSGCPPEHRLIHTVYGRGYLFGLRPERSEVTPATAAAFLSSN